MEKTIITISREFGAGGNSVGRIISEKLGIPLYDKKLVNRIAEESGFAAAYITDHGEHAPGKSVFSYAFASQGGMMHGVSTTDHLWNAQCSVILNLAQQGPCIIVGRNADYILKDYQNVLHVFLWADPEFKAKYVIEQYGTGGKSPEAIMQEKDKRRRVNYQHYTGRTWGMAQNYDLCLNTGLLGYQGAADMIISAINASKK